MLMNAEGWAKVLLGINNISSYFYHGSKLQLTLISYTIKYLEGSLRSHVP